jgi:hypothetical protein
MHEYLLLQAVLLLVCGLWSVLKERKRLPSEPWTKHPGGKLEDDLLVMSA